MPQIFPLAWQACTQAINEHFAAMDFSTFCLLGLFPAKR